MVLLIYISRKAVTWPELCANQTAVIRARSARSLSPTFVYVTRRRIGRDEEAKMFLAGNKVVICVILTLHFHLLVCEDIQGRCTDTCNHQSVSITFEVAKCFWYFSRRLTFRSCPRQESCAGVGIKRSRHALQYLGVGFPQVIHLPPIHPSNIGLPFDFVVIYSVVLGFVSGRAGVRLVVRNRWSTPCHNLPLYPGIYKHVDG